MALMCAVAYLGTKLGLLALLIACKLLAPALFSPPAAVILAGVQ
jgi:hypothetical protein